MIYDSSITTKIYIYIFFFFQNFSVTNHRSKSNFSYALACESRHCPLYMYTYVCSCTYIYIYMYVHVHSLSSLVSFRSSFLFFSRRSLLYDVANLFFIATREKRYSPLSQYSVNPRNIFSSCFLSIREIFYISHILVE